jgi:hypothetical protein
MSITIESDPTHDNAHTHMTPKDTIKFTTTGGIETIQWRSNHIVDDWTNLHTYERTDTDGQITGIDIIHQLEHLPGIDLDGNHTISIRGLQSNDSGGHSSSPLVTIDIMMMDSELAFVVETEETPGFTFLTISVASAIAIFVNQRKTEIEQNLDD